MVNGRPFLSFVLDHLIEAGISKAILCTGYKADMICAELGEHYQSLQLKCSQEQQPLGTAGALALAWQQISDSPILAMNGDSYCNADLEQLWNSHLARNAIATIQLTRVPDTSRYGRVVLNDDGSVRSFEEKGSGSGPGFINAGIYCLNRSSLIGVTMGEMVSLERQVFPQLIGKGLFGVEGSGRFLDIGTPESYEEAEKFFSELESRKRS